MKKILLAILLICGMQTAGAQSETGVSRPKLVVGIVVDQMRWDYLVRYYDNYCDGGFRRLLNEGFSCDNNQINYIPTVTAIGHSAVYTGSIPSIHGIAGNNFYKNGAPTYCTDDATVRGVGSDSKAGLMSPRNLLVTTVGDELRLATNFRSKVVSVSLKDRASILPGGHSANGAYWFDDATGRFITSTYYMTDLPKWVKDFNSKDLARKYLSQKWTTLLSADTYIQSTADDTPYEKSQIEGARPTLPLDLPAIFAKKGYEAIRVSPFGNSLTLDLAKAALEGEQLGRGTETDMLTVSLSSTDYIGHQFAVNAIETEDAYLRLDRDLADFLSALDNAVGKGNYLVFLTADHAGAHNWGFLNDHNIPAGGWDNAALKTALNKQLAEAFSTTEPLVNDVMNYQVFLNHKNIAAAGLDLQRVKQYVIDELKNDSVFAYVVDMDRLAEAPVPEPIRTRAINGYNRFRSGDIQLIMQPGYYSGGVGGTDHGVWNPYDAHIPLLFMGWGVKHGRTMAPTAMTDIAPTVCALLSIQMPNGCVGNAILPVLGE